MAPSPLRDPDPSPPSLLHVSFNQDYGCFAAATDRGFRIINCDPFREIFRRDLLDSCGGGGGVGIIEMLFRCNILALVGGGPNPQYPPSKVMIWDDHQSRCIGELSFRSDVRAVRLRRDCIVVVLDHKILVYNFADLKLLHQIETVPNPRGLCELTQHQGSLVLVCPGGHKGQVRIEHYGTRRTKFIMAHDSRIACFALSQEGKMLATASTKGTLVRIFSTVDGALLQEVRRGADRAEIYSLAFSSNAQWLALSSDKGTVHVFSVKVNLGSIEVDRPRALPEPISPPVNSSLSFIKGVLPKYFSSEWSFAQCHLHEGTRYVVAFGHQKNTAVILGMDGSFYRCEFDPVAGGEMTQLECHHFLKEEVESLNWEHTDLLPSESRLKDQNADLILREWSSGREGNIRSLLSTLQHVLWPGSGWKAVPLVDLIESKSVRRAYLKAALSLHPDKLQQKGATAHQKYIAEKVFDILQEAWSQFTSVSPI